MSSQPEDPLDLCHVDTVLGSVIQPLLQACRMGGQTLSKGDMALFMLNNVSVIRVSCTLPSCFITFIFASLFCFTVYLSQVVDYLAKQFSCCFHLIVLLTSATFSHHFYIALHSPFSCYSKYCLRPLDVASLRRTNRASLTLGSSCLTVR
jgi:hypothetical protein